MDEIKKQKLARFANDTEMQIAVYELLLNTYLEKNSSTVQEQAAERVAINLLQEAWKKILRLKKTSDSDHEPKTNIGV